MTIIVVSIPLVGPFPSISILSSEKKPLPYFDLLIFLLFFYLGKPWAWSFLFSLSIIFCIKKKNAFIDKNKRDDLEPENIAQFLDVT